MPPLANLEQARNLPQIERFALQPSGRIGVDLHCARVLADALLEGRIILAEQYGSEAHRGAALAIPRAVELRRIEPYGLELAARDGNRRLAGELMKLAISELEESSGIARGHDRSPWLLLRDRGDGFDSWRLFASARLPALEALPVLPNEHAEPGNAEHSQEHKGAREDQQ
jgi:hypothetical protein